jgi:hypothetical protein
MEIAYGTTLKVLVFSEEQCLEIKTFRIPEFFNIFKKK